MHGGSASPWSRVSRGVWRPHKVKMAVRLPAELRRSGHQGLGHHRGGFGLEIHVGGNGGIKTEVAQFLVKVKSSDGGTANTPARSCSYTARKPIT